MQVSVIGVGHVGLVTAACMADLGHDVVGFDVDGGKIDVLRVGAVPFVEAGLAELVEAGVRAGRLEFTADVNAALRRAEVVFICVGTPAGRTGLRT